MLRPTQAEWYATVTHTMIIQAIILIYYIGIYNPPKKAPIAINATGAFFYFQRRGDAQQTDKKPVSF